VGDSLVISWFLRSRETQVQLVIRSSVVIESERKPVEVLSVRDIWPMAAPIENEVAELFGVRFKKTSGETVEIPRSLLTEEQAGESKFPMRKSYQLRSGQMGERSK
jgi:NADH:ubiquinone oxidoreductase subunit C